MEMSFRVRVKRASWGSHRGPGDSLSPCLSGRGSLGVITAGNGLKRLFVSRPGGTFPLLSHPHRLRREGFGNQIGQLRTNY